MAPASLSSRLPVAPSETAAFYTPRTLPLPVFAWRGATVSELLSPTLAPSLVSLKAGLRPPLPTSLSPCYSRGGVLVTAGGIPPGPFWHVCGRVLKEKRSALPGHGN